MKALKKLALVSAVSMISAGAFAMEAMDDESMSSTTGQDGISILVSPGNKTVLQLQAMGVSNTTIDTLGQYSNGVDGLAGANAADPDAADNLVKGLFLNQVVIHDDDGIASNKNSGSLVIGRGAGAVDLNHDGDFLDANEAPSGALLAADRTVVFAKGDQPIEINIDMVGDIDGVTAGNQSMLNVQIKTPQLAIKTGAMYVSNSNAAAADINKDGGATLGSAEVDGTSQDGGNPIKIANSMEIVLGSTTINVQLGSEAQTLFGGAESASNPSAMILVDAALVGGLAINNSSLDDAYGSIKGGSIAMKSLKINNAGGGDLNALVAVNVEDNLLDINPAYAGPAAAEGGLVVTLGGLGGKGGDGVFGTLDDTGVDVAINNTTLGNTAPGFAKDLGDVQILGLQLGGTNLIIRGH